MTDLRTLTDAFDELARRGDAAEARMPAGLPARRPARRVVPITVAAAVVAGLATTVALLAPGEAPQTGATPTTTAAPVTPSQNWAPSTPDQLAHRFRTVLGDSATFTVTGTNGPAISGTFTKAGVTGGFDLQVYPDPSHRGGWCADVATCRQSTLPDGSRLWASTVGLDSDSITHQAILVRPDGVTTIMDLSNQSSPKGQSDVLSDEPPLTLDEVVAVVTDPRW